VLNPKVIAFKLSLPKLLIWL